MKSARLLVVLAAVAAAAVISSASRDAHALGPVDLEVAVQAGEGTNPVGGSLNPLGFGIGGRGGVGIFGFYGGVKGMYYVGGSSGPVSVHSSQYGLDLGYSIKLAILTIRPQVGLGNFTLSTSVNGDAAAAGVGGGSTSSFYLEPGVTGLVSLGLLFVGVDANALILTGVKQADGSDTSKTAFTLHGQVGLRF